MLLWDNFPFQRKPNFLPKALKIKYFLFFAEMLSNIPSLKCCLSSSHTTEEFCPREPPDSCCNMEILCILLTFFLSRGWNRLWACQQGCAVALRKGAGVGPGQQEKQQQQGGVSWDPPWASGQTTVSRNASVPRPRKPAAAARQRCFMHKALCTAVYRWLYLQTPQ